ncbi:large-conductance mechanosensitive channel [Lactobacillaceae bacterium L1_55_11]|nr:large-conductance mechanosensitive channel [Lactobacillaceae bacterium L1_55_11]
MKKESQKLRDSANAVLNSYNQKWVRFRRFIFAPYLLTFTISIVVGNSYGSAIKDMVTFFGGVYAFLVQWLFQAGHIMNFDLIVTPWNGFLQSFLTLIVIAVSVYYTVSFINNSFIKEADEKWGYDQYHEDMKVLQAELKHNNEIAERNAALQEKILAHLEKQERQ